MSGASDPESDELRLAACRGLLSQGWRLGVDLEDAYREAREIAERNEDRDTACLMLAQYSRSLAAQGEIARYVELNDECMRLAPGVSDVAIRANAWMLGLDSSWFIGDVGRSLRLRREYLESFPPDPALGAEIWGFGTYPCALMLGGIGLYLAARFEEAESDLRRAADLGSEREYFEIPNWCYSHLAEMAWLRGDPTAVTTCAQRAAEFAERSGNSAQSRGYAARAGIQSLLAIGSWAEAETAAGTWLAMYDQERVELVEKPGAFALLCEARRRAGHFEAAVDAAEQGLALAQQMPRRIIELSLRLPHAVALAHSGATAEAERSLDAAANLVEVTGAEVWRPLLHEARADLAGALGDTATREHELREAHRMFAERGCSGRAEQIARQLP